MPRSTRKLIAALAVGACAAGVVTGCGSSSSSANSSSGSSGAGGSSAVAKKANATTAKYLSEPTQIPLSTPLGKAPAKGKTFVNLQCNLSQCGIITIGIDAAARAVGWNVKTLTYNSADPGTLTSALHQALQYHPVATSVTGLPQAVWQAAVPEYKQAGSALVVGAVGPATTSSTVLANIEGPANIARQAQALANWFISDSGGKGKALLLNVAGFPILNGFSQQFKKLVASECPGCHVSTLNASVAQAEANSLPQTIATALRRDPSAQYFISCDAAFIAGLPAALNSAGLSKIKVGGMWGNQATEAEVKSGQLSIVTNEASEYLGALMVDAALRRSEHMAIPSTSQYQLPVRLLSKATVGTPANSNDYPSDWLAQLKKLWKVP